MRLRNKPGAKETILQHPNYILTDGSDWKGKWQERFLKAQPLHIEVGSGKGQFIVEMAKAHPEINYIGIEMQTNAIISILEKQLEEQLPNLQLLLVDGADLTDYFSDGEVDQVYLNFSDPWPKTRHEKRRLTYKTFLRTYETIAKPKAELHFKTDNQKLFEYSLASVTWYGMTLKKVWLDLHASDFEGNIMTEYEEKFSSKGQPIYRLEAIFNGKEAE
ncbi:tRNA (guanosine(46)-N7)-methyltransferase TrmB [Vagococcus fluvialis]|jgi:tRNA (guanine-N7-)-methyltransferase|uniref:tRNA (guanine-N(7)-)-methyltransferase n=1 Tax=Vagococcus fluvialis TaxID=2738 RepID=A0A369B0J3_9ENTE|nr:tRNA (guanosine(46)-N7)-methyltransferase TrmB [Vagococcus fluvialis]MDR2277552.1 tRNA (guanosine(46)-N7)-methyltransferase TrmB [Vagococcus sp.]OTP31451.1 tRNA (guanine-N(7)-)-methyltransferase [Enterococcus sp. 6C8_DIV0013]MBO0418582.1 tRNA (guanosine(46)-N7)-methyltransferase TrmB [Vagococcus fluvialis]MBO0428677.1 tRNA (guanosine(46)-N7)-methyltransferase TrmB [Vagococcus fluvialis]MBO0479860.1 tRNA (guanosine(46)-N7)-methyltransferase TrmB [Vagococcus fluvialis]